jgi:hypothetical protein
MTNIFLDITFIGFCIGFAVVIIDRRRKKAAPASKHPNLTRPDGDTEAGFVESSDDPSPWTALDDRQLARLLRDSCP